jgi:integrase
MSSMQEQHQQQHNIILTGEAYRNYIKSLRSAYTRHMYIVVIKSYMAYCKVSDINDLLNYGNNNPKLIQSNIIDYLIELKEKRGLAFKSRCLYSTALHHFYDMNDIYLNWKKINSFIGGDEQIKTVKDRPYTYEEIKRLLEKCAERERVVILLMASTGMREGAIHTLKIENLTKIEKYNIYQITVYENTADAYITFCTPECAKAIDDYLEYRKRYGEKITKNAPLIREQFDKNDSFACATPRPISPQLIRYIIYKAIYDAGLRVKQIPLEGTKNRTHRHQVMQSHGLRKFFDTTATKAGLNPLYTEILMAHKIGLTGIYFRPTPTDLLEGNDKMLGYVSVIDALTINNEHRLRRQVESLTEKRNEIQIMKEKHEQEMKAMREEMNQQFSQIMSMIQQNPKLAQVKPEILTKKKVDNINY